MRKYLNVLLVAFFAAGMMLSVGCGDGETAPKTDDKKEETKETAAADTPAGPVVAAGEMTEVSLELPNMT